jgi:hypothetical protein
MTSYLAVMGYWMTREWQLCSKLLSFSEVLGSHTGENLNEELYDVLDKFSISNKVDSSFAMLCVAHGAY